MSECHSTALKHRSSEQVRVNKGGTDLGVVEAGDEEAIIGKLLIEKKKILLCCRAQ